MFCNACGHQFNSAMRFCSRCGAPRSDTGAPGGEATYSPVPSHAYLMHNRAVIAAIALLVLGISIIGWMGSGKKDGQKLTQPQTSESVKSAVVDPREEILNNARENAREKYINKMQSEFRNSGVEATISDLDGDMVIVSDDLKLKPQRDSLMRSTFDPAYRKALCTLGFKTVELRGDVILGDGDKYSLCPETKEERGARLDAQKGQRQAFVNELQQRFNNDSGIASLDILVEQGTGELILTSPSAKDAPIKLLRSMIADSDDDTRHLCGIGFYGLRVRSSPSSSGRFISFNCGKTSN
jgi:hypothetical protein